MENVDIFYDHLEYCTVILVILGQFGIVCGHVVHFSRFGMFGPRKIWQPWCKVSAKPSFKKTPPNADSGDRRVNFKLRLRNIAFGDLGEHYIQTYVCTKLICTNICTYVQTYVHMYKHMYKHTYVQSSTPVKSTYIHCM
jgi:hypothetical protein